MKLREIGFPPRWMVIDKQNAQIGFADISDRVPNQCSKAESRFHRNSFHVRKNELRCPNIFRRQFASHVNGIFREDLSIQEQSCETVDYSEDSKTLKAGLYIT